VLGRRLIHEMRRPLPSLDVETASDVLRWGADDLDDEQVWSALLAALDESSEDGEYWELGDGFVSEFVCTRPALDARWQDAEATNAKAAEVRRVRFTRRGTGGFRKTSSTELPIRARSEIREASRNALRSTPAGVGGRGTPRLFR
jgi:hypothetical protein